MVSRTCAASGFNTLHRKWLRSAIFSPLLGRERERGAGVEIFFQPPASDKVARMRKQRHMGPLGMILAMIDTSRGRALVYNWRYLATASIIAVTALWLLVIHFR